jgi:hypothetical protein
MAERSERNLPHLILKGFVETEQFRAPRSPVRSKPVPEQDRARHGTALLSQIETLKQEASVAREAQDHAGLEGGFGLQIEFESFPDIELAFESLARERSGIELLNVRHEDQRTYATVFVPDGKLTHFEGLVQDYLREKRDQKGHLRDHKKLLNAIEQVRAASLRALWTDDPHVFPTSEDETFWWET